MQEQYRLRLRDPNDPDEYVDIPVNLAVALRDAKTGAQLYGLIFDNSENSGRVAHRRTVENPADPSQRIEVERIDGLILRDAKGGDERLHGYLIDNNDPPPRTASSDAGASHIRTHVVRYCRDNDPEGAPWVDVERIDCLALRDAKTGAQEIALIADWPPAGDPIDDPDDPFKPRFCEVPQSLPLVDRQYERINPPWRIDPLQNIVNFSGAPAVEFEPGLL
jgi:hypothetical protein